MERYNIIVDNYNDLSNFRELVLYNKSYLEATSPQWYSEFVGVYRDGTLDLTVDSAPANFEATIMPTIRDKYIHRSRAVPDTWHTNHTSIYDLDLFTIDVCDSSEDNNIYRFESDTFITP